MDAEVAPVTVHQRLGFTECLLKGQIQNESSEEIMKKSTLEDRYLQFSFLKGFW